MKEAAAVYLCDVETVLEQAAGQVIHLLTRDGDDDELIDNRVGGHKRFSKSRNYTCFLLVFFHRPL